MTQIYSSFLGISQSCLVNSADKMKVLTVLRMEVRNKLLITVGNLSWNQKRKHIQTLLLHFRINPTFLPGSSFIFFVFSFPWNRSRRIHPGHLHSWFLQHDSDFLLIHKHQSNILWIYWAVNKVQVIFCYFHQEVPLSRDRWRHCLLTCAVCVCGGGSGWCSHYLYFFSSLSKFLLWPLLWLTDCHCVLPPQTVQTSCSGWTSEGICHVLWGFFWSPKC